MSRELPPEFFVGPEVYGHEGSGVVEALGDGVDDLAVGDHVVLSFNSCGSCPACDRGKLPYCFNFALHNMSGGRPDGSKAFTDSDGQPVSSHFFGQSSFASHSVVARTSVVKVDPSYDLSLMRPLGCGIQTGAGAILNTLDVQPGASVVITGAGALGLSAVMAANDALLEHPEQLESLTDGDPAAISNAVEEMLRWTAPARHFMRTATADTQVGGQDIKAGDWLYLSYKAAKLDSSPDHRLRCVRGRILATICSEFATISDRHHFLKRVGSTPHSR